jgi:hypothetical protein
VIPTGYQILYPETYLDWMKTGFEPRYPPSRVVLGIGRLLGWGEYVSEARDAMSSCQGEELACIGFPHPPCEFFISCEVSLVSSIPLLLSMEY